MPNTKNGIYYADASTPMSAEAISAAEATSVDNVVEELIIKHRQMQDFVWVDSAARIAQTGMRVGDEGYQQDTRLSYRYFDGSWRTWSTLAPIAWTPVWTGLTVGNGTQDWIYNISSGRVFISGSLKFGTTTTIDAANPSFALPIPGTFTDSQELGGAVFNDAGVRYRGGTHYDTASSKPLMRYFTASGSNIIDAGITATTPFTWAAGDVMSSTFSYRAA